MNVFSSDGFLSALSDACHEGLGEPGLMSVDGEAYRTLITPAGPVSSMILIDYFEPAPVPIGAHVTPVRFVPRVSRRVVPSGAWSPSTGDQVPGPTIRWEHFATHDEFEQSVRIRAKKISADTRRRERQLVGELGPIELRPGGPSELRQCLAWKSEQYRRTGAPELFADRRHVALLEALVADGTGRVDALWAGDRLVAAHVGMHHDGRFYYWFPAYDVELTRWAPGRLLLHRLLRQRHEAGDDEFDFLYGDEEYKWWYATDVRVIEPVGIPGWGVRAERAARRAAQRVPAAQRAGKRLLGMARRARAEAQKARSAR